MLAKKIDWKRFDVALADCYCPDTGAPAKAIRLLVGLYYLKHAFNESGESLLERWVENPYWQCFGGFETMQHELPLHSTSLTKRRTRVGAEKLAEMLQETVAAAGSNLLKLLRAFAHARILWLRSVVSPADWPKNSLLDSLLAA